MGIVIRQSAVSTALSYVGVVIGYVNLLILFPAYMSPQEVGLARIVQDAAIIMVPFAQLGIGQLVLRFFPGHNHKPEYTEFVGLILVFLAIGLSLFTLVFFAFNDAITGYFTSKSPEVISYIYYILILTIILTVHQVMVAFSQSSLNIILPNFLKEVLLRAATLSGIILFAIGILTFTQFIYLLLAAYLLNLIILSVYLARRKILRLNFKWSYFNLVNIKPMLKFGLFTFLGGSGILIIGKIDSIMVTGMLGLTETAIYTTAFYIAVLIELPKRAIAQIGMPIISRAFKENNQQEIKEIYAKSSLNNLIIGALIFIGLWINLDNIFTLIPKTEVYSLGKMVVLIVGAGKLIDIAAGLNGEIIVMSKYYKVNVYFVVALAIFTVGANYILIPVYGLSGAAIGSAFALLFFNLTKFIFLYSKLKLQPFSVNTIKVILLGAVILLFGLWLPQLDNVYYDIFYRSVIVSVIYSIAIYLLKPSKDIDNLINKAIGRQ